MTVSSTSTSTSRGRPHAASSKEILDATLILLSDVGVDGFTMRQLAKRVGVAPMTLYSYFASKEVLLNAAVERFATTLSNETAEDRRPWRAALECDLRDLRNQLKSNPHIIALLVRRDRVAVLFLETARPLAMALWRGGFTDAETANACRALLWFVLGFVRVELSVGDGDESFRAGLKEMAATSTGASLTRLLPFLLDRDPEQFFEYQMSLILDGLELRTLKKGHANDR